MREVKFQDLQMNPNTLIANEWMLVTAGNEERGYNTMTASWGHLGSIWGHNGGQPMAMDGAMPHLLEADNISGIKQKEHGIVANARQKSNEATQPDSDAPVNTKRG